MKLHLESLRWVEKLQISAGNNLWTQVESLHEDILVVCQKCQRVEDKHLGHVPSDQSYHRRDLSAGLDHNRWEVTHQTCTQVSRT